MFIYSNGLLPQEGPTDVHILKNDVQHINIELFQLLQQMIHDDPVQRPTVSEISK